MAEDELESSFPGLKVQIRALRANGFSDEQILRGISARGQYYKESGFSGEDIDAWMKGRRSRIPIAEKPYKDLTEIDAIEAEKARQEQTMTGRESAYWANRARGGGGGLLGKAPPNISFDPFGGVKNWWREMGEQAAAGQAQAQAGHRNLMSGNPLSMALGAAQVPLGAIATVGSPISAFFSSTTKHTVEPMTPEFIKGPEGSTQRDIFRAISDTALSMPFGGTGLMKARARATRPHWEAAAERMGKETAEGQAVLDRMRKRGTLPPGEEVIDDIVRGGQIPTPERVREYRQGARFRQEPGKPPEDLEGGAPAEPPPPPPKAGPPSEADLAGLLKRAQAGDEEAYALLEKEAARRKLAQERGAPATEGEWEQRNKPKNEAEALRAGIVGEAAQAEDTARLKGIADKQIKAHEEQQAAAAQAAATPEPAGVLPEQSKKALENQRQTDYISQQIQEAKAEEEALFGKGGGAPAEPPKPTLQEAGQLKAATGIDVPTQKVETAQGPGTVVSVLEDGSQVVTQLPEDLMVMLERQRAAERAISGAADEPLRMRDIPKAERQAWDRLARGKKLRENIDADVKTGFSSEEAARVVLHFLQKNQKWTLEEATQHMKGWTPDYILYKANDYLRQYRIASGELTGKAGRPRKNLADQLQMGQSREQPGIDLRNEPGGIVAPGTAMSEMMPGATNTLAERMAKAAVRMPGDVAPSPAQVAAAPTTIPQWGKVRTMATDRGYELSMVNRKIRLVDSGGMFHEFNTVDEAYKFLGTKQPHPQAPVHLPDAGGNTTMTRAFEGAPLTKDDKANIRLQAEAQRSAKPLENIGQNPSPDQYNIALKEGQVLGVVQGLTDRKRAQEAFARVRAAGYEPWMIQRKDGTWDIAYGKDISQETIQARSMYNQYLRNPSALSTEDMAQLAEYMGLPPVAGGAGPRLTSMQNYFGNPQIPTKVRMANPTAGALSSNAPLVNQMGMEMYGSELAYTRRMEHHSDTILALKQAVPDSKRMQQVAEGRVLASTQGEKDMIKRIDAVMDDIYKSAKAAGQIGLSKEFHLMAQGGGDMKAIWTLYRGEMSQVQHAKDLPLSMRAHLTEQQFQSHKALLMNNVDWRTVSKPQLNAFMQDMVNFSGIVPKWEHLPEFIQQRLPRELFVKHFLPAGAMDVIKSDNYLQAFQHMIARAEQSLEYGPLVKKWTEVIKQMPGSSGEWFTERGMMEQMLDKAIIRRPSWDQVQVESLTNRLNQLIGRDILNAHNVDAMAQLMRNSWIRGLIGPDSAFVNLTQGLATWAEHGRIAGPVMKYWQQRGKLNQPGLFHEMLDMYGERVKDIPSPLLQRALDADRQFTSWALAPQHYTEHFNRGVAFLAAMEEAAAKGLSATDMIQLGFRRASSVSPNYQVSEAVFDALTKVVKTQVGQTPATRAPMLTGRGPITRMSTMLMSYPAHTLQFLQSGLVDGWSQGMMKGEWSKMARYIGYMGALITLPMVGHWMGADFTNFMGPQALWPVMGLPLFNGLHAAYGSVMGETPQERERDQYQLKRTIWNAFIPQGRYIAKIADPLGPGGVTQNIARGHAIDRRGRFLYETTTYGEMMRLLGINPEQGYEVRTLAKNLQQEGYQYSFDKQKAVDAVLDGDPSLMMAFVQKWGVNIDPEDLQRAMQERYTRPEQRAIRGMPKELGERKIYEYRR